MTRAQEGAPFASSSCSELGSEAEGMRACFRFCVHVYTCVSVCAHAHAVVDICVCACFCLVQERSVVYIPPSSCPTREFALCCHCPSVVSSLDLFAATSISGMASRFEIHVHQTINRPCVSTSGVFVPFRRPLCPALQGNTACKMMNFDL